MRVTMYERRRFVRVAANLHARLNASSAIAIKDLCLGGCLIESPQPLGIKDPIDIGVAAFGDRISLGGHLVHELNSHRYGVRFDLETNTETSRLIKLIENLHRFPATRRPTRLRLKIRATLDKKPATLSNLSAGGCFLESQTGFHPGDIVEVHYELNGEEIHVAAQVRWLDSGGIGVEYLSPEPDQVRSISDFIEREYPAAARR